MWAGMLASWARTSKRKGVDDHSALSLGRASTWWSSCFSTGCFVDCSVVSLVSLGRLATASSPFFKYCLPERLGCERRVLVHSKNRLSSWVGESPPHCKKMLWLCLSDFMLVTVVHCWLSMMLAVNSHYLSARSGDRDKTFFFLIVGISIDHF